MRGLSGVAGAALQQLLGLLAAVAAEIFVQQIDHRPEVAAFLDIHLEHVAHVVERGRGLAEMALLLDRGRLGVALDHDQPAQHGAIFARHFLPGRLAVVRRRTGSCGLPPRARAACPSGSPASSRSRTWPSLSDRPTPRCADRRANPGSPPAPCPSTSRYSRGCQVSSARRTWRSSVRSTLLGIRPSSNRRSCRQSSIASSASHPFAGRIPGLLAACRSASARRPRPTALGRWKIQFCQAVRRREDLASPWSPGRRSGDWLPGRSDRRAKSWRAPRANTRTSSSQSMSSSAKVTRPSASAALGIERLARSAWPRSTSAGSARKRLASRERPLPIG